MLAFIVLILFIYCFYLHKKISSLEKRFDNQAESTITSSAGTTPVNNNETHQTIDEKSFALSAAQQPIPIKHKEPQSDVFADLGRWLSTDWLLKLGAFLLILGIGWFVSYAFAENWIGPVGRITLGMSVGAAILIFGESWNKRSPLQATIFMVVGATAILLTTYAARTVYDFFTPLTALLMMAGATIVIAYSSVLHKIENRAIVSLVFAALVPFLTASENTSVIGLLSYGFVVIAGTLWIVSMTGWRRLSAVALVVYGIYALLSMFSFSQEDIFLLRVLAFSFTLLFYAVGLITHLKVKVPSPADYLVSLGNALIMVLWIQQIEAQHLASVLTCLGAVAFFFGAFLLFKATSKSAVILEYTAVALALVASAATFELDGDVLTITYSLLACVGIFLTLAITRDVKHAQTAGFLLLPVFLRSLVLWLDTNTYGIFGGGTTFSQLITWWTLAVELAVLGYYFYKQGKTSQNKDVLSNAAVYLIGGLGLSLLSLWESVSYIISQADTAHAVSLVTFTIIGLFLYIYGRLNFRKKTMYSGAAILGFVVFRLLAVEIWTMVLFQRVIIFSLIGILLMATAFIKPQKKVV